MELIPIIDDFIATGPSFFEIMEDGLAWVEMTGALDVLLVGVMFEATMAFTTFLTLL